MITQVINDYVSSNGTFSEMDSNELHNLVNAVYPQNRKSFLPEDYCYNRTNEGVGFEAHAHLFARTENGKYCILGEDYPYSGPVIKGNAANLKIA